MEERGDGVATNRENSRRVVLRLAALRVLQLTAKIGPDRLMPFAPFLSRSLFYHVHHLRQLGHPSGMVAWSLCD